MLDDNQNVHDVAALLKEFFRDMKDSLLPDDLYMSFLLTASESTVLTCWGKERIYYRGSSDKAQAARPSKEVRQNDHQKMKSTSPEYLQLSLVKIKIFIKTLSKLFLVPLKVSLELCCLEIFLELLESVYVLSGRRRTQVIYWSAFDGERGTFLTFRLLKSNALEESKGKFAWVLSP